MTSNQKDLIYDLLDGDYLMKTKNPNGRVCYKLYYGNMNPKRYVSDLVVEAGSIWNVLKQDKKGKFTINKSKVRQLHGNSLLKKIYKSKLRKIETNIKTTVECM